MLHILPSPFPTQYGISSSSLSQHFYHINKHGNARETVGWFWGLCLRLSETTVHLKCLNYDDDTTHKKTRTHKIAIFTLTEKGGEKFRKTTQCPSIISKADRPVFSVSIAPMNAGLFCFFFPQNLCTTHKLFAIRKPSPTQMMASEGKVESSSHVLTASQSHTVPYQELLEKRSFPCRLLRIRRKGKR